MFSFLIVFKVIYTRNFFLIESLLQSFILDILSLRVVSMKMISGFMLEIWRISENPILTMIQF